MLRWRESVGRRCAVAFYARYGGYAVSIGTFVAGSLGFAGSLGIGALVENGEGWRLNLERRSQRR